MDQKCCKCNNNGFSIIILDTDNRNKNNQLVQFEKIYLN